jgi:protein-S-isoprenylcysteine O-methyltransferase Ste14
LKTIIKNDEGAELPQSHLLQLVYLTLFFIAWFLDSFIFNFSTFLANLIPLLLRVVFAIIVLALGLGIIELGHSLFNKKLSGLVTDGIFAHVRHPIYLGTILVYLGFIIGTMSLLSFVMWLFIIRLYVKMANYEEQKLEQRFGEAYLEYKRKVPKWIPR